MTERIKPFAGPPRGLDTDVEFFRQDVKQANCPHSMSGMSYEATYRDEFGHQVLDTAEFICSRCDKTWTVEAFNREFKDELAELEKRHA